MQNFRQVSLIGLRGCFPVVHCDIIARPSDLPVFCFNSHVLLVIDLPVASLENLGPVSSKHLGRSFVLKTSYDISRTDFLFHQTLKRWEVLTFCPKLRTKKSASYHGIFVLNVCN